MIFVLLVVMPLSAGAIVWAASTLLGLETVWPGVVVGVCLSLLLNILHVLRDGGGS